MIHFVVENFNDLFEFLDFNVPFQVTIWGVRLSGEDSGEDVKIGLGEGTMMDRDLVIFWLMGGVPPQTSHNGKPCGP